MSRTAHGHFARVRAHCSGTRLRGTTGPPPGWPLSQQKESHMKQMMLLQTMLTGWFRDVMDRADETGASLVEYALLLAHTLTSTLNTVGNSIALVNPGVRGGGWIADRDAVG